MRIVCDEEPETKRFVLACRGEHSMYCLTQTDETSILIRKLGGEHEVKQGKETDLEHKKY